MRKNQSKFKNEEYVQSLIQNALKFKNITFIERIDNYAYFECIEHGKFKKRLDHLIDTKHHVCPKCSKKIYAKIAGKAIASKCNIEDYVDINKFKPLEECKGAGTKIKFLCIKHNQEFYATPQRCFGCDMCKKEHHYKWEKDWRHIDQEEIIRRCKKIHPEYDYSMVKYVNASTPIDIICPKHGVFRMTYANLTNKTKPQNCPFCSKMGTHKISKMTKEVLSKLNELNIKYITEKTFDGLKDKKKLPIDIWLPDYNIAIECQGEQHFRFVKSFCKNEDDFEYIKYHDKLKFEFFKNSNINLLYYTRSENKNLIPNNYFDYVYTNIDELINFIVSESKWIYNFNGSKE